MKNKIVDLTEDMLLHEAVSLNEKELQYLVKKYPHLTLGKAIPLAVKMKKILRGQDGKKR